MSPLLPVLVVVLASVLGVLLSRKSAPPLRWVLATLVGAVIEYASVFVISGFGWGWSDPSRSSLILGRLAVGLSITVSSVAFAWLSSSRRPSLLVTLILLFPAVIMLPEFSYDGPWGMALVLIVTTYAIVRHFRVPLQARQQV